MIHLAFATVTCLALLSREGALAFTSIPSCIKAEQTVQTRSLASEVIWAVQNVKQKLDATSSIVQIKDVFEQMPLSVDKTHHDLKDIKDLEDINKKNTLAIMGNKLPPANEVWIARLLLLLSAALYGTNFTMVKSLDESLSVGISSTLRFGFAAFCMLPWLLAPIHEDLKTLAKERMLKCKTDLEMCSYEEPTRLAAGLAGLEIGAYNSIGYITQAVGLKTIPANKVSTVFVCIFVAY